MPISLILYEYRRIPNNKERDPTDPNFVPTLMKLIDYNYILSCRLLYAIVFKITGESFVSHPGWARRANSGWETKDEPVILNTFIAHILINAMIVINIYINIFTIILFYYKNFKYNKKFKAEWIYFSKPG